MNKTATKFPISGEVAFTVMHLQNVIFPYTPCTETKIGMKSIPIEVSNIATNRGKRSILDISCITNAGFSHSCNCLWIMDEYTNLSWSLFLKGEGE
jgi:hypothetical protein